MAPPVKFVVVLLFLTCLGALTRGQVGLNITIQPSDILTRSGVVASFECIAEGSVNISYQWQKLNDTLDGIPGGPAGSGSGSGDGLMGYVDVENAINSTLEFNPVMFGDEGAYRCIVSGTLISNIALLTVSPEGSVEVSPLNETFDRGDNVTFTCSARGGPDNTFQWLRNGTELVNETSETFFIPTIAFMDGDEYTCTVSNTAGNESVSTFLFVRPEIMLSPTDVNTTNDSFIVIMCDAEAFPLPEFEWVHIGGDIGSNIMGADTNMLVFDPVLFGDEGDYFCNATSNGISVSSDSATITVSPEGSVDASPPVINATRNASVEFICSALGGPGNIFTWTRLSDEQEVSDEQTLQIFVVNAFDGSRYECLVENEAGNETATVVLNVAVAIDVPPVDTNVSTTEEVILTCSASGYPAPFILWTHNGTDIDENDNRTNITESNGPRSVMSTLTVSRAVINDSGEYVCNAANTFSTAVGGPVIVLVQDTPEQPQNVTGRAINSTAIQLNWFEPHDNNAPILGYRVRYTRPQFLNGSDVELNVVIEMAVITGLRPGVTYNFTVTAFNELGGSQESAVAMVATGDEEPASPPQNVVASALSSTEIMVTWEEVPMIDQNGNIINYEIQIEPLDFPADIMTNLLTTTNLSILVTGLEEYVNYSISVRAYTSVGPGPYSDPVTERTFEDVPATPPQNVNATAISSTEIVVTWNEIPGLDRNGIIINYEVQIEPLDFSADIMTDLLTTTNLSILVTGLEEYVNYNISVRAYTIEGPGPYSNPVTERTLEDVPGAAPQNVATTVVSSTAIIVFWSELPELDQNGIIITYEVQLEPLDFPAEIFVDPLNTTDLQERATGLQEAVNYSIRVRAYTSVGPGPYSDPVTARTFEDVPATPPPNVQATAISSTEIMVTWDEIPGLDQNGIIIDYEIQIEPLDFTADIVDSLLRTTNLSILVTELEEYVNYSIAVRAYTSVGPGPYSDPVTERTFEDVPATPPQNVEATVTSSTEIMVTWDDVPGLDQNGIITDYEVQIEPLDFPADIMTNLLTTTNLSILVTGLEEDVNYNISVRAYTSVGAGPYSDPVTERTLEDVPATPPPNVQATAISSTEIMVAWDEIPELDQNGIIIDYEVQIEPLEFRTDIMTNLLNITNLSILVTGLEEYVNYTIRVRAYTSVGPGPYSDFVTERTFEDVPAEPPQNVQATATSSTEISVTWDEIPGLDQNGIIIEYEVQIEPLDFPADIPVDPLNTTSLLIVVTGLEEYVNYSISVRAYTSVGPGPYSDPVTERTLEDEPAIPPQNVQATVLSSTQIMVTWEEVPAIDQNGIITIYEVRFDPLQFTGVLMTEYMNTTDMSVVLTSLQEYVEYNISVRAYTSVGPGPFSEDVTERTFEDQPASPPQNVRTTAISSTEIDVRWIEVPMIDENGIIINYEVQVEPLDFNDVLTIIYVNTTTLSTVVSDLQEFVEYNISVRAYTSVGPGPFSPPVTDRTLEDQPTNPPRNVQATALSSTEIMVTWERVSAINESGIITNYEVEVDPVDFTNILNITYVNTTNLSTVITGLQEYVEYDIRVRAYTVIGPGPFSPPETERTFEDEPATAPRNVEATAVSSTEIMVTWEEVLAIDENGIIIIYEVQFEPLEFTETLTTRFVNTTDLTVILSSLQEYVEYNISVRAYTSVGPGPYSDPVTQRTLEDQPATPPQNVMAIARSSTEIMVTWAEVLPIDQNGIITIYEVRYEPLQFMQNLSTVFSNTTGMAVNLTNLQEYVEYNISVRAYTAIGFGPFSTEITERTFEDEPATPPQNVQTMAPSSTEIMVTWEEVVAIDENGIIINYEVRLEPLEFTETLTTSSVNTTNLTVLLSSLQEYVEYNISVRAYTSVGPGPYSDPVTERTLEDRPATPPQNVSAIARSSTEIMVTWAEVLPIDQNGIITIYEIRYEPLQFIESLSTLVVNTTDMAVNLTNLQEYVEYDISVRAYTAIGFGPFSTEITERTFEDEPATPPQNVQTTVDSSTEIMVTWEEVAAIDENGVIINYEVQFVPLQFTDILELDSINTTDLMIVISGLEEYVEYNISVRAYTSVGPGPFSVAVTNRTFEDEPATSPLNVETIALSSTEIMVTWMRVVAIDENGIIINYEVQYQPLQFTSTLATTSINTSSLSANITALQEYVEYNISVRAYTSVGPGPYSDPVTQRTLEDSPAGFPQNVSATTLNSTEIRVNWEPVPAIEENGIIVTYEILYDPQETFSGQISNNVSINTTDGSVLEMILNDLQEFVEYDITVRAYTSIGSGPYNPNGDRNRTFEDVPVVAPDNLVVENISANELAVSWERPTEIDINGVLRLYIIEYYIVDQSDTLLTVNVTGNMTVLDNLNNFTDYNVSVAAFTVGTGPFSSEIERTSENVPGEPPQNVEARNESSTNISVQWESPPQEFLFGILRGYIIRFVPGEMDIVNSTELIPSDTTSFTLENLLEFTNYSIEVTAVTGAGEGPYSPPVYVVTNPDLPGGVDLPPPVQTDDFNDEFVNGAIDLTVRWNPPRDPNGVITQYIVEFVAISTNFPRSLREKRQSDPVQQECIMGGANNVNRSISVPGDQTSATLEGLTAASTYEFRVQGETTIGLGPFSEPQNFTTPEFVPTEPRDLTVQYLSSSSLEITWNHPLCDYGVRTNYTVTHEPIDGAVGPLGEVGTPGSPSVQEAESTSLIITELTPNTNYSITVYASTGAGPGNFSIEVNQTDEDIPQVVTNLNIVSEDNTNVNPAFRNNVIVEITWTAPSFRNGSFNYNLTYTAAQTDNYPELRRGTAQDSVIIAGRMEEFTIEDALPFANYTVTIFAFNIKLNAPGDSETEANRSVAIAPTAVTNLQAVPNSFSSIRVTWSIPDSPNGPVDRYAVYYRDIETADIVQEPPIQSADYESQIVPAALSQIGFELVIQNLVAFNFYAIHVQPLIGGGSDLQADFVGDVDLEIPQRTNSTTIEPPTVGITDAPTSVPTVTTIFVYPPPTSQFVTGPLMFYAIIVVDTRQVQRDFLESPPDASQFDDAPRFDETERQPYYITAAWDDSTAVPSSFIIGNESTTVVDGTTYVNGRLRQGRQYAVFYRIEIVSDNAESLVVNSAYVFSRTASESNAAGIGVGIFFGLLILILIVATAIVLYMVYRRKYADKYTIFGRHRLTSGEVALDRSEQKGLSVIANPLVKMAHTGTHDPVPVPHFADHVKHLHANDDYLFSEEYSSVEPDHAPSSEATLRPENQFKNRYANITSYDHSRVRLQEVPGGAGSDYINANHIDGYNQPNAFIATQGPVPGSVSDFWRMIWEQGTATIVMLTNLEEKGRLKCHKYWPDAEKASAHGTIRIHLQESLVLAEYTVRTFSLQREGSKEERIVNQYHFTVWPDHGVPEYPTPLLHFVRKVAASNPINAGPIVVHCSAGVGRTGTFITLDAQMKRIKAEENLDIFNFVRAMRYRRCFMVQTEPQYVFIHDAMLEVVECDVTEVPARDLQEQYKKLGSVDPRKGRTGLEIEFEKLDSTIHRRPPRNISTLEVNKPKNRYTTEDMLPYDKSRCRLSTIPGEQGSDYINASNIDGYHKRSAYIATQGPLPDTADDFWRMIWEQKSATIVMLTQERERGRVKCYRYWPESGAQSYGNYQVILHAVNEYPDYILREFKIVDTKDGSSLPVKQFQYTGWPEEGVPDTGSGLIDLIGQVQKWQMSSGDRPIVVHCSGGCGRTGTFIAVDILLERLKTEGVVDVFSIVRRIRLQRPGMVQSVTQYEFCYKTVLEFLDSFELYSNFK